MSTILYGIPNCDTVKKARTWLEANGIEYRFHNFRKDGIDETMIREWMKSQPLDILLNKRGTTWRQLPENTKNNIDEASAVALMVEQPAMIKRPVVVSGKRTSVGFKEKDFQAFFGQ